MMNTKHSSSNGQLVVFHSATTWLEPTQTWLYNQVRYLPDSIESHVVTRSTENLDRFPVQNLYSLDSLSPGHRLWETSLRKLRIRRHLGLLAEQTVRHKAQVLHSHFSWMGWENLNLAKHQNVKHVVTFYGLDVCYLPTFPRWKRRYEKLFEQIDLILCEGPHMAQCIANLGCSSSKIRVHHLGVPTNEIDFQPRRWNPGQLLRILIAASFREKKGIQYAIEALGRLRDKFDFEITIIGDASASPESQAQKKEIESVIDRYKLRRRTRMLGFQPHDVLMKEATEHHVFLSPSVTAKNGDTEGGVPVTIIELMASGMPIVSSQHCDIPGVVIDGRTGYLAPERDVDGLCVAIEKLLQRHEDWQAMLAEGRAHVEREFDACRQGMQLAGIYEELVHSD